MNELEIEILDQTVKRAAGGRYCGGGEDMDSLVEIGLMKYIGTPAWCPDKFYAITDKGRAVLIQYNANVLAPADTRLQRRNKMIDTQKLEEAADSGLPGMTCSASLVWHAGPANDGGGTCGIRHGIPWWYDGDLLLVIVETTGGREFSVVRVSADGSQLSFANAATGDDDFGYMGGDISWWAKLDENIPRTQ